MSEEVPSPPDTEPTDKPKPDEQQTPGPGKAGVGFQIPKSAPFPNKHGFYDYRKGLRHE